MTENIKIPQILFIDTIVDATVAMQRQEPSGCRFAQGPMCSRTKSNILDKSLVKSRSPDTENHDKNGYGFQDNNKNFIMTNVDNTDTTYTNTNYMNKHDTRDLHK